MKASINSSPDIDAAKIASGVLDPDRIPILDDSKIPNLDASKITTGKLPPVRLGSGTANSTTYLRGDQTWESVPTGGVTVVTANPTQSTNPASGVGAVYLNSSTGRLFVCADATTNLNVWVHYDSTGWVGSFYLSPSATFTSGTNFSANTVLENGALYWLGTSGKTTAYSNVHTSGKAVVTWSALASGTAAGTVDRTVGLSITSTDVANSFVRVDFGATRTLRATTIVWQHSSGGTSAFRLQTYSIQGSNDASTSPTNWTTIVTYSNSPPENASSPYKVDTFVNTNFYRHYRILQTGLNTSSSNILAITDFEFFGIPQGTWL